MKKKEDDMKKNVQQRLRLLSMFLAIMLMICPMVLMAADTEPVDPAGDTADGSFFQNPAQAQKAENLSAAAAQQMDVDMKAAEAALAEATASGDTAAIAAAEQAITDLLAKQAASTPEAIEAMRADGMGWGEIAHALGLHPGTLGLGHAKKIGTADEISDESGKLGSQRNDDNGNQGGNGNGNSGGGNKGGGSKGGGSKGGGNGNGNSGGGNKGGGKK